MRISLDAWLGLAERGQNVAVVPRGRPAARNTTDRAEPCTSLVRIIEADEPPWVTETVAGVGRTTSLTFARLAAGSASIVIAATITAQTAAVRCGGLSVMASSPERRLRAVSPKRTKILSFVVPTGLAGGLATNVAATPELRRFAPGN